MAFWNWPALTQSLPRVLNSFAFSNVDGVFTIVAGGLVDAGAGPFDAAFWEVFGSDGLVDEAGATWLLIGKSLSNDCEKEKLRGEEKCENDPEYSRNKWFANLHR